jgi:hypothetical protein
MACRDFEWDGYLIVILSPIFTSRDAFAIVSFTLTQFRLHASVDNDLVLKFRVAHKKRSKANFILNIIRMINFSWIA